VEEESEGDMLIVSLPLELRVYVDEIAIRGGN
jgi:hypothetical protein